ncbi:MAG: hypothetical protein ACE5GB_08365 [Acidimicrobiales bacterium]
MSTATRSAPTPSSDSSTAMPTPSPVSVSRSPPDRRNRDTADTPSDSARVPIPPNDATVHSICCEYCPIACGYKVYTWPAGTEGGPAAADNVLGTDYPSGPLSGRWPSQNMHAVVQVDGVANNCIIIPDADADVVNVGGNHSVRGGSLATKVYRSDGPTSDRLTRPRCGSTASWCRSPGTWPPTWWPSCRATASSSTASSPGG